jgi:hypothetical protein
MQFILILSLLLIFPLDLDGWKTQVRYMDGAGLPKDDAKAVDWLQRGAALQHPGCVNHQRMA